MALTMAQAYTLARNAGFDPAAAVVMAAIDMAESGLNPNAVGDVALQDGTWGPSIGLGQIRSLKAQTGTGATRDVTTLRDPAANMAAAYQISNHGKDFTPWTTYTSGKYRQFLTQANAGAGGAAGGAAAPVAAKPVGLLGDDVDWRAVGLQVAAVGFGLILVVAGAYQALGGPPLGKAVGALSRVVL